MAFNDFLMIIARYTHGDCCIICCRFLRQPARIYGCTDYGVMAKQGLEFDALPRCKCNNKNEYFHHAWYLLCIIDFIIHAAGITTCAVVKQYPRWDLVDAGDCSRASRWRKLGRIDRDYVLPPGRHSSGAASGHTPTFDPAFL